MLLDAVRMLLRMCFNATACTPACACASHALHALPHALLIRYAYASACAAACASHTLPHAQAASAIEAQLDDAHELESPQARTQFLWRVSRGELF
jgi:hypothetical protein